MLQARARSSTHGSSGPDRPRPERAERIVVVPHVRAALHVPALPGSASANSPNPRFERGGPARGSFKQARRLQQAQRKLLVYRGGSFDKDRPARPAGSSFRRDKPAGDYPPPRTGEGAERPRFRPAGTGSPRFGQSRPGRPPARAGERPSRPAGERPSRPFRAGATGTGEGRSSSRPDRPFRKPFGDRPASGPRRFDSRPPRRDGPSRPQGDRPFKRPYSPAGTRPPQTARPDRPLQAGGPASSSTDRAERTFTPRPRPEGVRSRPESGERGARPFRASGPRPGGFSKPGGRPRSFSKPGFAKPGYRKSAAGGTGTGKPQFDRPRV